MDAADASGDKALAAAVYYRRHRLILVSCAIASVQMFTLPRKCLRKFAVKKTDRSVQCRRRRRSSAPGGHVGLAHDDDKDQRPALRRRRGGTCPALPSALRWR